MFKCVEYKVVSGNRYHLNAADELLLEQIKNNTFDEEAFFRRMRVSCNLNLIIKLANINPIFNSLCKKDIYNSLWEQQYCLYGLYLSASETTQIVFLLHKNVDMFDLLQGAYFFHKAQQVKKQQDHFSLEEIFWLKKAITFNSVHAVQRYNHYLYSKIEQFQLDSEYCDKLLKEAIENCKSLLELYGSYAYMMLAEAYFHYANWAIREDNLKGTSASIDAAIRSCDLAQTYLDESQSSIHNASLGKGLEASNSFEISEPLQAKTLLENWLNDQQISNQGSMKLP
ncbi:DUF5630 domain-containing protein [Legionella anisa]|uniref:Ankyrin repeat domain-containing protein n=1 Tax=Legionella anisa TaxID=28082 RepID=A0AAX0WNK9_9GAMM|nr:DUF5630 domain-containing protein [Legionella anisa]AWN73260.1 hypothetical protein DLD14_05050 [Legionella anisa]KTC67060.1 Ankyrin repeat protein [Legionella anisa]MBN5936029.1 DUF5630 domain-containing protein [Legionella anisa]MCW8424105.1 DUF5630 domain-containing protein [Legionella anisa]MCW8447628.1 DUF5630 domain-containing protein [Legionella anisa]